MGMGMSSYSVALNTYFVKRRSKVTGYVTAMYGVGTILFPQLVSFLLANFTIKDSMLIITAIFGHTLVSAILLQPVQWHMKVEEIRINDQESSELTTLFEEQNKKEEINVIRGDLGTMHASMTSLDLHKNMMNNNYVKNKNGLHEEQTVLRRISAIIVKTFDLSLLADPVFTNIIVGLSIDFFVEFNYLLLIPFMLMEGNLSVEQTASFMSVYAIADIAFRLFAPFIGSILQQNNRVMYIISLVLVVISRSFLAFVTNYILLLFVAAAIGAFRGMRLVYWSIVIPEYAPTERLAAAFGLLFTLNGLCLFIGGPILGILRDISKNYKSCILVLNLITTTTITIWTIEMIHRKVKLRKAKRRRNISEPL
ncbi:membrane transporter [Oryctes borbonicus]|uniref:Membrane transporter n=1 Tax=Oryctes borbonicus TaxID=1629725 RepID=A0A0T6B012_9SCAR|nr:membrane transporter [Oryctes borbonicus]